VSPGGIGASSGAASPTQLLRWDGGAKARLKGGLAEFFPDQEMLKIQSEVAFSPLLS